MKTHFSLFAGIGGLDLAAEWAGFTTVGQCEWADYPTKVLEKHWPNVPRWRDIRSVTAEDFYNRTGLRTVDLISGGFPCQPFSVAGKQKGKRDDRYLWPEMLRIISEIKPTWVLGENVPGILSIAGKTVCEDLEREGYAVAVFNFEAAAVGAPHRRERVFFVANSRCESERCESNRFNNKQLNGTTEKFRATQRDGFTNGGKDVADTDSEGLQRRKETGNTCDGWENRNKLFAGCCDGEKWRPVESRLGMLADGIPYWLDGYWRVEPDIPRVATGVKNRVDRLKCLGNAVVPQQVYPILKAIAEIENMEVRHEK